MSTKQTLPNLLPPPDRDHLRAEFREAWSRYVTAGARMRELLLAKSSSAERAAIQLEVLTAKGCYEAARDRYVNAVLGDLQYTVGIASCGHTPTDM